MVNAYGWKARRQLAQAPLKCILHQVVSVINIPSKLTGILIQLRSESLGNRFRINRRARAIGSRIGLGLSNRRHALRLAVSGNSVDFMELQDIALDCNSLPSAGTAK